MLTPVVRIDVSPSGGNKTSEASSHAMGLRDHNTETNYCLSFAGTNYSSKPFFGHKRASMQYPRSTIASFKMFASVSSRWLQIFLHHTTQFLKTKRYKKSAPYHLLEQFLLGTKRGIGSGAILPCVSSASQREGAFRFSRD